MLRKLAFVFIGISLLSYLLIGCAVKPEEDVYLNPIIIGQEQSAGAKSVTMSASDVSITATGLDTADLLTVSSDPNINPYIDITGSNIAKSLYTVFNITVKNNRSEKIVIDPALAVLIDEDGTQYESIPYETFKLRFPAVDTWEYSPPYYQYPYYFENYNDNESTEKLDVKVISDDDRKKNNEGDKNRNQARERNENRNQGQGREGNEYGRQEREYYYYGNKYDYCDDWGDCYWDWDRTRNMPRSYYRYQSSSYYKKAIAQKTLFASTNLYPNGTKSGFLAFPLLSTEEGKLKIIIPVTVYNGQSKAVHFEFQFKKTPAISLEKE